MVTFVTHQPVLTRPQSKDDGSTPSAEVLMKGLEQNVRKVLEKKRQEFDKLSFQVKAKQAQVEKLKVQLIEVERDSEALGITKEPNPQRRLKSNKQVSTRKLYLDDSVRCRATSLPAQHSCSTEN